MPPALLSVYSVKINIFAPQITKRLLVMMMRAYFFSFLLLAGLLFTSCDTEESLVPTRTILVYMAADNNLNDYSYRNLNGMVTGAAGNVLDNGNLLVYHDSQSELPQLIQIKKGKAGEIEKEIIRTYENRNSASVEVMKSVLNEVFNNEAYKAESYALLLWSHGTAWLPGNPGNYLRSYGVDDGQYMEIYELQEALKGYTFDFIIFDDCYMANIEVAYTLRNQTDYILASPTEVLAYGLPYHKIIPYLFSRESVPDLLKKVSDAFYTYYENQETSSGTSYPKSASITLVKTTELEPLASVCREILLGQYENTLFDLPLENIQRIEYLPYPHHALYDFGDFIKQPATPDQYSRFEDALQKVIIYKLTTDIAYYGSDGGLYVNIDRDRFCGLSAYIPQKALTNLNEWYKRLDWYKAVYE
jgi:hypothetical protein